MTDGTSNGQGIHLDVAVTANDCASKSGCQGADFVALGFDAVSFGAGGILGRALSAGVKNSAQLIAIGNKMAIIGFDGAAVTMSASTVSSNVKPSTPATSGPVYGPYVP